MKKRIQCLDRKCKSRPERYRYGHPVCSDHIELALSVAYMEEGVFE